MVVTRQPGHTKVTIERHDGRNVKRKTLGDIGSAALDPLRDKLEEIMDGDCPYDVGRAAHDIAEMALVALNAPE